MNISIGENKTVGKRLRAWRKSVPLTLVELSEKVNVSQGSLSDLENDKSLPSAMTLTNLFNCTDLNVYWLLTGQGPVNRNPDQELCKTTETSQLYKDFLFMMEDKKLKDMVSDLIKAYNHGERDKKAKIAGFLLSLE